MEAIDFFVSHASADSSLANRVVRYLESRGNTCWIAPRNIHAGEDWSQAIVRGIRQCERMLLLVTDSANESEHVKREVERAVRERKPIIPILTQQVKIADHLDYFLSTHQWVDATGGSLEEHLSTLVRAAGADIGELDLDEPVVVTPQRSSLDDDSIYTTLTVPNGERVRTVRLTETAAGEPHVVVITSMSGFGNDRYRVHWDGRAFDLPGKPLSVHPSEGQSALVFVELVDCVKAVVFGRSGVETGPAFESVAPWSVTYDGEWRYVGIADGHEHVVLGAGTIIARFPEVANLARPECVSYAAGCAIVSEMSYRCLVPEMADQWLGRVDQMVFYKLPGLQEKLARIGDHARAWVLRNGSVLAIVEEEHEQMRIALDGEVISERMRWVQALERWDRTGDFPGSPIGDGWILFAIAHDGSQWLISSNGRWQLPESRFGRYWSVAFAPDGLSFLCSPGGAVEIPSDADSSVLLNGSWITLRDGDVGSELFVIFGCRPSGDAAYFLKIAQSEAGKPQYVVRVAPDGRPEEIDPKSEAALLEQVHFWPTLIDTLSFGDATAYDRDEANEDEVVIGRYREWRDAFDVWEPGVQLLAVLPSKLRPALRVRQDGIGFRAVVPSRPRTRDYPVVLYSAESVRITTVTKLDSDSVELEDDLVVSTLVALAEEKRRAAKMWGDIGKFVG